MSKGLSTVCNCKQLLFNLTCSSLRSAITMQKQYLSLQASYEWVLMNKMFCLHQALRHSVKMWEKRGKCWRRLLHDSKLDCERQENLNKWCKEWKALRKLSMTALKWYVCKQGLYSYPLRIYSLRPCWSVGRPASDGLLPLWLFCAAIGRAGYNEGSVSDVLPLGAFPSSNVVMVNFQL